MRFGKLSVGVLLALLATFPVTTGGADNGATATASARITLHILPRVQLRQMGVLGTDQLCLNRVPANRYYLSIRDLGSEAREEMRLAGRPGNYCVPMAASVEGKMVVIVAE
ncbi:hypothetical protein [Microbulbifer thermotolerans]|nr:hypothetical protein [Microbulbifer thermotolerans]MCX2783456.1 hypothetical protein [Microbulbifer thermotolerans]MCX2795850.1 hypothetical protein [Microbulbifer thermotolerans]MCX2836337.1 hypothetical protein [Microbulbifer thermotolerans]WKT59720.1 hypothetical protein Q2E61_12550 [Microbulbifer thermotolerans]SFC62923.1 hypothetical protein SAMN05660479_02123 [Microbulbifer thermotolerans]